MYQLFSNVSMTTWTQWRFMFVSLEAARYQRIF